MSLDSVSYSSMFGRLAAHVCFKVKFCHRIFDDARVKNRCEQIFRSVAETHGFGIDTMGFDGDHVHAAIDFGPSRCPEQVSKLLKGTSAKFLLREFPFLKREYFWGSGLWNPSYYCKSVGDRTYNETRDYVKNQGKPKHQTTLTPYFN